jgi:hypothetical protein
MECRLAAETEVLGENLPQRHFCPSQNSTWLHPGLNPGRRGGKPATNRLSCGAAIWLTVERWAIKISAEISISLTKVFINFPDLSPANYQNGTLKLVHGCFLPPSFQFTIIPSLETVESEWLTMSLTQCQCRYWPSDAKGMTLYNTNAGIRERVQKQVVMHPSVTLIGSHLLVLDDDPRNKS